MLLAADLISGCATLFGIGPIVMSLVFWNIGFLVWGVIVILTNLLNSLFKYALFNKTDAVYLRPPGAMGCGPFNHKVPYGGRPGFPSGHMAMTVSFFLIAYLVFKNVIIIPIGIIVICLMAWARMTKQCHNWQQVLAGILSGMVISISLWWLYTLALKKNVSNYKR